MKSDTIFSSFRISRMRSGFSSSAAAYHIAGHDEWGGWSNAQRRNRLHFLVSNRRFLIWQRVFFDRPWIDSTETGGIAMAMVCYLPRPSLIREAMRGLVIKHRIGSNGGKPAALNAKGLIIMSRMGVLNACSFVRYSAVRAVCFRRKNSEGNGRRASAIIPLAAR